MRKYTTPKITKEDILEKMYYDPEKGLLWAKRIGRFARPGLPVGGATRGQIRFNGFRVYTSHIVWFLHHGYWPSERKEWIDHKDGDISNELISNLRAASPEQNNMNRSLRNNKTLPKGVTSQNNRFRSSIQFKGNQIFLGYYETMKEAEAAYQGASRALQKEFSIFSRCELSEAPETVMVISEKEQP